MSSDLEQIESFFVNVEKNFHENFSSPKHEMETKMENDICSLFVSEIPEDNNFPLISRSMMWIQKILERITYQSQEVLHSIG